ncbi:MAG: hypothetical protein OEV46_02870 [Betaproteobacteria bacterium]|nr:hypothetical protein [Betaproteobacteria bacterium]MDH5286433.1 hypothetical protein [Betaproteobacteria bacterium]
MDAALRGLAANLLAGARTALLLPVARTSFRIDAAQLLLLAVLSALIDVGTDWLRLGPDVSLDVAAFGSELTGIALLVLIAALLAWAFGEATLVVALPVVVLAALPLTQLCAVLPPALEGDPERPAWVVEAVRWALLAWYVLVLGRSAYVALEPHAKRWLRAVAGCALLAAPLLVPPGALPDAAWWSASGPASFDPANPAAEPVLSLQRELQDDALAGLSDHARGATDLYFVAFAPDSGAGAWRERVEAARDAMDEHWGTEGRSLVYVNDFASLTEVPIASVTHLREALEEIAAAGDPEEDVVMLYLAGRSNADGSMTVDLPPLGLVQLSGPGLASLLAQAGIRWSVIVVATCAPQSFVDALADAETLVMAAGGGCDANGEPPGFHEALFGGALTAATTLPSAFALATRRLAAQGHPPTMHVGEAIAGQLERLRHTGGARAALGGRDRG